MNTSKSFIKWGVIGGLGTSIYGLLMYIMQVPYGSKLVYLGYFAFVAVILFGSYEFRDKENNGFASFGQIFKNALKICIIFSIIATIWSLLYVKVINPGFIDEILLQTEIQLEEKGLDREQIDMSLEVTKKMMTPVSMLITGFLFPLLWGLIISLPVSLALQKKETEEQLIQDKLEQQQ